MEIMNDKEYSEWIGGIARRYKQGQIKAATIADVTKKGATKRVEDVAKYPVSAEKIKRLYKAAEANGFASYAEA